MPRWRVLGGIAAGLAVVILGVVSTVRRFNAGSVDGANEPALARLHDAISSPASRHRGAGNTLDVMAEAFVPEDFTVPEHFVGAGFRLECLGPDHNDHDHDAWMSSIDHIRATPGFPDGSWPSPMSLEDNLADLVRHADDFARRAGFTYSVLDGDEVIGCVYIYPSKAADHDASVQSWVRASRADVDVVLWRAMTAWLQSGWPFANVDYAARS